MDEFTPFVKTKKMIKEESVTPSKANWAEFSFIKTLLEPDQCNSEMNATKLANALHQYSENQKTKMDLDESFNLLCSQTPHNSDSGISTDGLQLVEDLQCELKEKEHLAQQLRSQLDFTDRQHEETIAALTAERDSLKKHLNMVREENATLTHVRGDYDEACERLCAGARALHEAERELEGLRRRARLHRDQLAALEAEKLSLQDLLSKSKDECHRINEMYASRQSALLEENETLKSHHADLSSRLQDQDEYMKQVLKEKLLLEMELKDMLNKSNHTHLRLDRSIDISYTEDQMLTALDSLNADSRFSTENRILDEDSFTNALRDDPGRSTNMSLFDEIRMSFNMSRLNVTEFNTAHCDKCSPDNSFVATATQTEDIEPCSNCHKDENHLEVVNYVVATATQTNESEIKPYVDSDKDDKATTDTQTDESNPMNVCAETQTDKNERCSDVNKVVKDGMIDLDTQTDFAIDVAYSELNNIIHKTDLEIQTDGTSQIELNSGGDNAHNYCNYNVNQKFDFATSFQDVKNVPYRNENKAQYKDYMNVTLKFDMEIQTEVSIENGLCFTENNDQFLDAKDYTETATQTVGEFIRKRPNFIKKAQKLLKLKEKYRTAETQTDEIKPCINNNNAHFTKCLECDSTNKYTSKLERDVQYSNMVVKELEAKISAYENNLTCLEALIGHGKDKNEKQQALVDILRSKIDFLESACETQRNTINEIASADTCCVQSQTEFDMTSSSTQTDMPCSSCEKRNAIAHRGLRRFFWEPLKCLFQMFVIICFLGAVSLLYGVSQRGRVRCDRERGVTPWRWFDAQDVMDLLLRIEYTSEVPM